MMNQWIKAIKSWKAGCRFVHHVGNVGRGNHHWLETWETCSYFSDPPSTAICFPIWRCGQMQKQQRIVAMHSWISSILAQPGCWILRESNRVGWRRLFYWEVQLVVESIWYQSAKAGLGAEFDLYMEIQWWSSSAPMPGSVACLKGARWAASIPRRRGPNASVWWWDKEGQASLAAECIWYHHNQSFFFFRSRRCNLERLQSMQDMHCTDHFTTWLNLWLLSLLQSFSFQQFWIAIFKICIVLAKKKSGWRSWWRSSKSHFHKKLMIALLKSTISCQVISVVPATLQAGNYCCFLKQHLLIDCWL